MHRHRSGTPVVALTGSSAGYLKSIGCDPTQYDAFLFKPTNLELVVS
jgi:hypothetical protein